MIKNKAVLLFFVITVAFAFWFVSMAWEARSGMSAGRHGMGKERGAPGRPREELESLFKTENAWYYSYFIDMISAPSAVEGWRYMMAHNRTEWRTVNCFYRFNIFQEVFAGTLFQWLDLASVGVEPMAWYVMLEFSAYALGMGAFFAIGCMIWDGSDYIVLGGLLVICMYFGNHYYASRIWTHPPLRENWAIPWAYLQLLSILLCLRRDTMTRKIFLITVSTIMVVLWQFSQFLCLVQCCAVFVASVVGYVPSRFARKMAACFMTSLVLASILHGGNTMILTSLGLQISASIALSGPLNGIAQTKVRQIGSVLLLTKKVLTALTNTFLS